MLNKAEISLSLSSVFHIATRANCLSLSFIFLLKYLIKISCTGKSFFVNSAALVPLVALAFSSVKSAKLSSMTKLILFWRVHSISCITFSFFDVVAAQIICID